jgi:hypothetical protein
MVYLFYANKIQVSPAIYMFLIRYLEYYKVLKGYLPLFMDSLMVQSMRSLIKRFTLFSSSSFIDH